MLSEGMAAGGMESAMRMCRTGFRSSSDGLFPYDGGAMPTVHLISGLPCSGKTTYAIALRKDVNGMLFTLDRWLITAFGKYEIADVGQEEHTRRVLACRELIWEVTSEFLRRSVDVILDDGFFLRAHRIHHVELANAAGASSKIHYLATPPDVIRSRIERRNVDLPPYNFTIDPDALQIFAVWFEVPRTDEGAEIVVVRNTVG